MLKFFALSSALRLLCQRLFFRLHLAILAAFLAGVGNLAHAQTNTTWASAGDTTFSSAVNWTAGAPINDTTSNIAQINGTGYFIPGTSVVAIVNPVLTASQSVAGVAITSGGYTLSATGGAVLTLGSSGLTNNVSGVTTVSAPLAGTGGIVQSGGTLVLSGSNSYTGPTQLGAGTLDLNSASALGASSLQIGLSCSIDNTSGAPLTLSTNNPQSWALGLTFTGTNSLNLGTGSVQMGIALPCTVTVAASTLTVGGPILGLTSLTKAGAGTLVLSGNNAYLGSTTISAGTLLVTGSLASASTVLVASGGTVGGTGTINGAATIQSGGALAPGSGAGNLSFARTLTLASGSTSALAINGTTRGTTFDAVNVAGLMTYGGAMTLDFGTTVTGGTTLNLFALSGGSSGDLASITATGSYPGSFVDASGVWTLTSGGQTLTFTDSTGDLVVTGGSGVPEPSMSAVLAGAAALGLAALRRRRSARL